MRQRICTGLLLAIINTCLDVPAIADEHVGSLDAATSPTIDGYRFAVFELVVGDSKEVTIELESSDFDTYLTVIPPEGQILDNDDHDRRQSMIRLSNPARGNWYIVVSSFKPGEVGEYRLSVGAADQLSKVPHEVLSDDLKQRAFDRAGRARERDQSIRDQLARERRDILGQSLGLPSIRREIRKRIEKALTATEADIVDVRPRLAELEKLAGQLVLARENLANIEPRLESVEELVRDRLNSTNGSADATIDRLATLVRRSAGLGAALNELAGLERSSEELGAARARLLELQNFGQFAIARDRILSLQLRVEAMKRSYAAKLLDAGLYMLESVDHFYDELIGVSRLRGHNLRYSSLLQAYAPRGETESYTSQGNKFAAWIPALLPWPPPEPSARAVLPRRLLEAAGAGLSTLGDADGRLTAALDAAGYDERAYHGVPSGFALVTRLERINSDGTPTDQSARWRTDIRPIRAFSLREYLRALFTARSGHFRVLVFIVTSEPFNSSGSRARLATMELWSRSGLNVLPPSLRSAPYTENHAVTVLIYEFKKIRGSRITNVAIPGRLTGQMHLEKSGLLAQLERR